MASWDNILELAMCYLKGIMNWALGLFCRQQRPRDWALGNIFTHIFYQHTQSSNVLQYFVFQVSAGIRHKKNCDSMWDLKHQPKMDFWDRPSRPASSFEIAPSRSATSSWHVFLQKSSCTRLVSSSENSWIWEILMKISFYEMRNKRAVDACFCKI